MARALFPFLMAGIIFLPLVISSPNNSVTIGNSGTVNYSPPPIYSNEFFREGWENYGWTNGSSVSGNWTVTPYPGYASRCAISTDWASSGNKSLKVVGGAIEATVPNYNTTAPVDLTAYVHTGHLENSGPFNALGVAVMEMREGAGIPIIVAGFYSIGGNPYYPYMAWFNYSADSEGGNTQPNPQWNQNYAISENTTYFMELVYVHNTTSITITMRLNGTFVAIETEQTTLNCLADTIYAGSTKVPYAGAFGTESTVYLDEIEFDYSSIQTSPPPPVYTGPPTLELHTSGKDIEYPNGTKMTLLGVWEGMYADSSTGWWGTSNTHFDEVALNQTLDFFRSKGVNVFCTFIWGDWWTQNMNATLFGGNNQTDMNYQQALLRTAAVCADKGMYFQIRLYGMNRTLGRIEGYPFSPSVPYTVQDFVNIWGDISSKFKNYNNVIYTLFDEPTGVEAPYFAACDRAIAAIRSNETSIIHLTVVHWGYCGDVAWIADYVNGGHTTTPNIVFSDHNYRSLGTDAWNSNSPITVDWLRGFRNSTDTRGEPYSMLVNYTQYHYNVPIWISAIGADDGGSDDSEYVAFRNTLEVYNEMGIGYAQFSWTHTSGAWTPFIDPMNTPLEEGGPLDFAYNRVGQALFDAIAGLYPPNTAILNVTSNDNPVIYAINGTATQSPHSHTLFVGNTYNITMPSTKTDYTHSILLGSTAGEGSNDGSGYSNYAYGCSPLQLNSTATVSSMYIYATKPSSITVAIYNLVSIQPTYRATTLVVANNTGTACTKGWNLITFASTTLPPGLYAIIAHSSTSEVFVNGPATNYAGMAFPWNGTSNAFPANVTDISDTIGGNVAVYVPSAPLVQTTQAFSQWEDGSTNPVRSLNLTTNIAISATYQRTP